MSATIRAFFAITLSPATQAWIAGVIKQLDQVIPEQMIHWTKLEKLHVTLQFLQSIKCTDIPRLIEQVELKLIDTDTFNLELTELELFPKPEHPRLIALKAEPADKLAPLAYCLGHAINAIDYQIEKRAFRGHVTLGRFHKYQPPAKLFEQICLPQLPVQSVEYISLLQSNLNRHSSTYLLLKQFPLRKACLFP